MKPAQPMPNGMPFGRDGFPRVEKIDAVRNIVTFHTGETAPITSYLAGGEEVGNPLRAQVIVCGPYRGKWLVIPVEEGDI
ncbi:hypothetical protein CbK_gp053 [Caulobacter phage phiCbK]|uniref:Uncharacterized protein n=5 Tax=Viruses TaxID=10239 RepID=K4JRI4_9CAUD|nr:hypothetical protein D865_gp053 [Caulobacter phage phiCbK]AFU86885.1 hypothetical protein CbK_gp053 [Caulobacter phage phiCbK]